MEIELEVTGAECSSELEHGYAKCQVLICGVEGQNRIYEQIYCVAFD